MDEIQSMTSEIVKLKTQKSFLIPLFGKWYTFAFSLALIHP